MRLTDKDLLNYLSKTVWQSGREIMKAQGLSHAAVTPIARCAELLANKGYVCIRHRAMTPAERKGRAGHNLPEYLLTTLGARKRDELNKQGDRPRLCGGGIYNFAG
jgi:hypothetical protein